MLNLLGTLIAKRKKFINLLYKFINLLHKFIIQILDCPCII
jgi:hypothetical protein